MKNIFSVLILVIGMMASTMSATTPTLDKKQKTTIVTLDTAHPIVANVASPTTVVFIQHSITQNATSAVNYWPTKKAPNLLKIITDVGWRSCKSENKHYNQFVKQRAIVNINHRIPDPFLKPNLCTARHVFT